MTWIPDLNTGQGVFALIALVVICLTIYSVVDTLANRGYSDDDTDDELADRIEESIKASTVHLLDALNVIEEDTTRMAAGVDQLVEDSAERRAPVRMEKFDA